METDYPFLRDPRALSEIRKHQWIESEKSKEEIGFGSAAVDWIQKFGEQWKRAHVKLGKDNKFFLENRKYRRFELFGFAALIYNDNVFSVETVNVSYLGLLCISKAYISARSQVVVQWSFENDGRSGLIFSGFVERITSQANSEGDFELLVRFDEESRKRIAQLEYLNS